jgi:hypothetical protein
MLRHVPQLQRNSAQEVELIAVLVDEIRIVHKLRRYTRTPALSTMPEALRSLASAVYTFHSNCSQGNYNVIVRSISQFWTARTLANQRRREHILNPAGKSEPAHGPAHFQIPPDCFIHEKQSNDPARIVAHIDHARHAITANNRFAEKMLQHADRLSERDCAEDASRLARGFARDAITRSNRIESQLAEFRSIHK